MRIIGWDVGGANTKASLLTFGNGKIIDLKTKFQYFPIFKEGKEKLVEVIREIRDDLIEKKKVSAVGLTMTAELADAYRTKREGVLHVLDSIEESFKSVPIWVCNLDGNLISIEEAREDPLSVAAANWPATAKFVTNWVKSCIIIDIGSTTTDIIPVINGKIVSQGKTDLERLIYGELVYTGMIRTNICAVVDEMPVIGKLAKVSSEYFSNMGDVNLILGNISPEEYIGETPDGRENSIPFAMERLSRMVCADIEMLSKKEILIISRYIQEKQIFQIFEALTQVYSRIITLDIDNSIPVIVTGIGKNIATKAAKRVGFENLRELCKQLNKIKEKHKILIVPGGSVFTDLVRKICREYGLSETSAHFMAILGMDQFGFVLSDLIPESMLVFTIEKAIEAIRDHKIPILIPFKLIFELNSLPHSWKVTSDSIALFIAKLINAKNFIKLTDVNGIYQSDPKNSDEKNLLEHVWASDLEHIKSCIDDFFPNLVKNFEGECWILNGRYPQRIIDLLENKETIGTKIIS